MSAALTTGPRTDSRLYVHKLRLEAHEGADVHITPSTTLIASLARRMAAQLIGASLAVSALLAWLVDRLG